MTGRGPVPVDEPVVLATKLHPPVRRGLVPRPALVRRLQPTRHRLTVLDAPAGWGKTSLLAQWCSDASDAHVAWLALDPSDDDPVLFWSYVVAALRRPLPGVGEQALRALRAGGRALRDAALPSLLNELAEQPGPIVLVLDDYHVITDATVRDTVALLVARLPPHAHVVVTARGDPPLPLGRLRAAGELLELRVDDLAFDDSEVAQVVSAGSGVRLIDADVARLVRRTEGWPAGVALAAASLATRGRDAGAFVDAFTGTDRYVLDYLGTEVLGGLPPDLRQFLLHSSVLRRLSAESCRAVTGRADAAALLDRAERGGLFLSALDPERQWFRYHRLFAELLRHELTLADPAIVPTLHRRAAGWSMQVGAVDDAVAHHLAAGDAPDAADLVADCWIGWFNAGRLGTVASWLDQLPEALVRADPRLCVARAWLLLDLGRLDDVDAWIASGEATGTGNAGTQRDLAVLRATHRFKIGDLAAMRAAARRVLELDDGSTSFPATVAHLQLGICAYWSGNLAGVLRPLSKAVAMARRMGNVLAETYALGYMALAAADAADLEDAGRRVPVALELCSDPEVAEHFVATLPHLASATLWAASGRLEAAATAAERALALARRGAGRLELALALATAARTAPAVPAARQWLDEARHLARTCRDPGPLPVRLARIRLADVAPATTIPPQAGVALSERERELLPLLAGTLSQREIGAVLHLSVNTVKTHGRVLFRKLGVSSRADAVARARELGLL